MESGIWLFLGLVLAHFLRHTDFIRYSVETGSECAGPSKWASDTYGMLETSPPLSDTHTGGIKCGFNDGAGRALHSPKLPSAVSGPLWTS